EALGEALDGRLEAAVARGDAAGPDHRDLQSVISLRTAHAASPVASAVYRAACARPAARRRSAVPGSSAARMPSASPSGGGATRSGASRAPSGIAPRALATSGDPHAIASTTGSPNPS